MLLKLTKWPSEIQAQNKPKENQIFMVTTNEMKTNIDIKLLQVKQFFYLVSTINNN